MNSLKHSTLVQEHLAELAIVEKKRAALSATASAADGTVVVTVDARGVVSKTMSTNPIWTTTRWPI